MYVLQIAVVPAHGLLKEAQVLTGPLKKQPKVLKF